jgi:hypothetical protein
MTCHDFQIGQHLSKNLVICWVKTANFGKLLSKLFTEKLTVTPYRLRQISLEVSLCKSRILNILRKYKYHLYNRFLLLMKKVRVKPVMKYVLMCRQFASQTNLLLH